MGNQSALDPGSVASTEIFGGSERALVRVRITNPIFGEERKVNAKLNRSNGCEIERWDRFEPLLDLR